ncbi:MAG: hypothetical protein CMK30_03740 [Porticoccaceae bacterium]|nr:hypothetical protein [Porticoccaceae bacterium]|tara:strand:- start:14723 stop:15145 length:423 start_codon:yes stop_codon:yes gene_type:complete
MTELKTSLMNTDSWIRLGFVLLFLVFLAVARGLLFLIVLVQSGMILATGTTNKKIRDFSGDLSLWVLDTLRFVTFTSEHKAFPFSDWSKCSEDSSDSAIGEQQDFVDDPVFTSVEPVDASDDVPSFTADQGPSDRVKDND